MGVLNGRGNVLLNTTDTCPFPTLGTANLLTMGLLCASIQANGTHWALGFCRGGDRGSTGGGFLGRHLYGFVKGLHYRVCLYMGCEDAFNFLPTPKKLNPPPDGPKELQQLLTYPNPYSVCHGTTQS